MNNIASKSNTIARPVQIWL